jgi:transcriptional regulator with XRE-family HTH domain
MRSKNNTAGYQRLKIGAHIRKWRSLKEIKQKDLANALRLSEAAISNMENDLADITLSQLEDISIKLDIPVEKLFSDPQEAYTNGLYSVANTDDTKMHVMEKDILYAMFGTLQKKDEHLKIVVDNVLEVMKQIAR